MELKPVKLKHKLPREVLDDLARSGLDEKDARQLEIHIPKLEGFNNASRYRLPYFDLDGSRNDFWRDRFIGNPLPKDKKGKPQRYTQEKEKAPRAYFPPIGNIDWQQVAGDPKADLLITEGEKKSAAACKAGFPTVGLGGVWNWVSKGGSLISDLTSIKWKERRVYIVYDSDAESNKTVRQAENQLQGELTDRGAHVSIVRLPAGPKDKRWGLDDYLLAQGAENLRALLDAAESKDSERRNSEMEGFSLRELMKAKFPDVQWVIDHFLPTGVTVLAGRPKTGKSWMALQLVLDKTLGARALGQYKCSPGGVLYLALEDTPKRAQTRIEKLIGKTEMPMGSHLFTKWPRVGEGGLEELRKWLDKNPEVRLVFIDTLAKMRKRRTRRGDIYSDDYDDIADFKNIADERGIAIVLVCHTRKSLGLEGDALDEVMGTTGMTGAPDTVIVLKRPRLKEDGTMLVVGRDAADQNLAVHFSPETHRWRVLGDAEQFTLSPERQRILDAVKKIGKPATPIEVSEWLGKGREGRGYEAVKKTIFRLHDDGRLKRVGTGQYVIPPVLPVSLVPSVPSVLPVPGKGLEGQGLSSNPKPPIKLRLPLRISKREAA